MKKYTYSESITYYVDKAKNSKSPKQAWFYYYKARNSARFYDLTDKQFTEHKEFMLKFGEAIKRKFDSAEVVAKPTNKATPSKVEATIEVAKPVSPEVSKNGRTNNALRVQAVIKNLQASIEILEAIK